MNNESEMIKWCRENPEESRYHASMIEAAKNEDRRNEAVALLTILNTRNLS